MFPRQYHKHFSYGCIFCKTGYEQALVSELSKDMRDTEFLIAKKKIRRRINGEMTVDTDIMFPGYVFFRTITEIDQRLFESNSLVLKLLTYNDKEWKLIGDDYALVRWLFSQGGMIGFSKAIIKENRLVFLTGPLMGLEDRIIKINRRFQNCLVDLVFERRKIKAWLGYELEEKEEQR